MLYTELTIYQSMAIINWFAASKCVNKIAYPSLMVLLDTFSFIYKLLSLILCPNILRGCKRVSLFPGWERVDVSFKKNIFLWGEGEGGGYCSLFYLMRAIVRAHASTRVTSLMRVKSSMPHFCL